MGIFNIFSKKEAAALPFATDIHCHVIPGVDDGSPDVETSVSLVEQMVSWGITRIIASPHVTEETFENTPDILDPALEELQTALAAKGMKVDLSRSSENRIDDFFRDLLAKGLITTLPNNYILVENSFIQEPWQLDQFLFDLKIQGLKPIMAHPERFAYYHGRNMHRYDDLHRAGNLFQVNLLSLAGAYSKEEKKVAETLIAKGFVDFIGTDLHNQRHAEIISEYLRSSDARKHFKALEGRLLNDKVF